MKKTFLILTLLVCITSQLYSQDIYNSKDLPSNYGMGNSLGFALFGEGLGLMARHTFSSEHQLGAFIGYAPVILQKPNVASFNIINGFGFKPEFNYYLGSSTKSKQKNGGLVRKLKKQYISIKEGITYASGTYNSQQINLVAFSTTLSFHQQRFLNDNTDRSTGFDVGINLDYLNSSQITSSNKIVFGIYLRWDWAWFLN